MISPSYDSPFLVKVAEWRLRQKDYGNMGKLYYGSKIRQYGYHHTVSVMLGLNPTVPLLS